MERWLRIFIGAIKLGASVAAEWFHRKVAARFLSRRVKPPSSREAGG